jgi:diguanylate cyclase (GGDEF)-like protein
VGSRKFLRRMVATAAVLVVVLAIACATLRPGLVRTAFSDIVSVLLLLIAVIVFAARGWASSGRLRWFWMLQSAGWAMWFSDQMVWVTYDLILQEKMPSMHPADALLFLAGAPMMAGLLLRPHREPSERSARLGALDFALLFLWWLYLYISLVMCWQYISPNADAYNLNFDNLSSMENLLLAGVLGVYWFRSTGKWKRFYAAFWVAVTFNGIWFYIVNRALEQGTYFTGSWYDIPYSGSFAIFTAVALFGVDLVPVPDSGDESYSASMTNLAMTAVLSLPILGLDALSDSHLPGRVSHFRVLVALVTMFLMALLLFLKHRRLNRELQRTNVVLQEASLTDPLTGLRNRRFFSATIEADVSQALRSHADNHDPHTRDLVFYLIDADNFKEVNDRYGHDVGDKVLVEMARRVSSSIRHSDVLVRWGGEEFLIVSRYTDRKEAELLAERVLSAVADTPFMLNDAGEKIFRTCSLGWASFPWFCENPRAVSYEEVLTLADRALQRAKQTGRNRAVGMLAATGKLPATAVAGLHSRPVQVDVLAIAGPPVGS